MMLLAPLLALALAACGAPAEPAPPAPDAPMTLFDFDGTDGARWQVVNDGVMGGRSQGFAAVADGTLAFTGELVTQGGGFTSVRADREADLSGYDGLELRVRGGGRTFELDVSDGTRQGWRQVSRRAAFPTTTDWQTVRVPFASLETSVFGQSVRAHPLDASAVESIGLFIVDGIDGPFRLEVDWIRAYAGATDA